MTEIKTHKDKEEEYSRHRTENEGSRVCLKGTLLHRGHVRCENMDLPGRELEIYLAT